jgi:hypothetical protein
MFFNQTERKVDLEPFSVTVQLPAELFLYGEWGRKTDEGKNLKSRGREDFRRERERW